MSRVSVPEPDGANRRTRPREHERQVEVRLPLGRLGLLQLDRRLRRRRGEQLEAAPPLDGKACELLEAAPPLV